MIYDMILYHIIYHISYHTIYPHDNLLVTKHVGFSTNSVQQFSLYAAWVSWKSDQWQSQIYICALSTF